MESIDAWHQQSFDDANESLSAELGIMLKEHRAKLVLSGDISEALKRWSQPDEDPIPNALWNMCDSESVGQVYQLFHDAGANAALTNTCDCGPNMLRRNDVASSAKRVCSASVRAALSCAPQWVVGLVEISVQMAVKENGEEARLLSEGLLDASVHGLLLQTHASPAGVSAMLEGVHESNGNQTVPRPIILALDAPSLNTDMQAYIDALKEQSSKIPELVGVGVSGVRCERLEEFLPVVREVTELGLESYVGFCSDHFIEPKLVGAAEMAIANGVNLMRCEAGIPIAGTSVLAEALGV